MSKSVFELLDELQPETGEQTWIPRGIPSLQIQVRYDFQQQHGFTRGRIAKCISYLGVIP
jgi:hypothetical protein